MSSTSLNTRQFSFSVCLRVLACIAVLALVLLPIAWQLTGTVGAQGVVVSAAICTVPALGLVLLEQTSWLKSPFAGLLVGTFLRMAVGVTAIIVADRVIGGLKFLDFYLWLAIFYCVSLAAETYFLSRSETTSTKAG